MSFQDREADPYRPRNRGRENAKETVYYFVVRGEGAFPLDMLRYDNAWACTRVDHRSQLASDQPVRAVICATHDKHSPTDGRWQSFNWLVIDRRIERPTFLDLAPPIIC